eukprot:5657707-Alexandrium_andersonii.AAC.1
MPPVTVEPPSAEVPPEMPPAPNSIEPLVPPPMAGGAEDDGPNAPWPDERGEAEVTDRVCVPPRKDTKRPPKVTPHDLVHLGC